MPIMVIYLEVFRQVAVTLSSGQNRLAYGGHSLGGLAAVYSLSVLIRSLVSSLSAVPFGILILRLIARMKM